MKNLKIIYFALICFQFSIANALTLKEDSLKNEFDIKDPRNPHCECLKYQKLADDEYQKLIGQTIKLHADNSKTNYTNTFSGNAELNSKNRTNTKTTRLRNKTWNFFNIKKKKVSKRKKIRRFRKDNTSCFHF